MDRHLFEAFLESLAESLADRVARRLDKTPEKAPQLPAPAAAPPVPGSPVAAQSPEFLTPKQAAKLLGVTEKGLEKMRAQGRGPGFTRVGRRIRYRRDDL
jgi:excisionase family DNA binding protein